MLTNNSRNQGFFLLELITAIALLLFVSFMLYMPTQNYLRRQYAMELRIAAQEFGANIRAAQQRALFGKTEANRIIIFDNKEGYTIEAYNRSINFKEIGCSGVYFDKYASNYINYSIIGAPNKAGDYILKHKKDASKSYILTIQPSSGRVDIHEQ